MVDIKKIIEDFANDHNIDGYYRKEYDIATNSTRLVVQFDKGNSHCRTIYITQEDGTIDPTQFKYGLEAQYLQLLREEAKNDKTN